MNKFRWKNHFFNKLSHYLAYLLIVCLCAPAPIVVTAASANAAALVGGGAGGAAAGGTEAGGAASLGGGGGGGGGTVAGSNAASASDGGAGGNGSTDDSGGAGGQITGPVAATDGSDGGGGGGGAAGKVLADTDFEIANDSEKVTGGKGGNGDAAGGGGGGGAGVVNATGLNVTVKTNGEITGGKGGGTGTGTGGGGGVGLISTNGGNVTVDHADAKITGGAGGAATDTNGNGGNGGDGLVYSGNGTVTNKGEIAGGAGGNGNGQGANGNGGNGVYITGGATLVNEGTIKGGAAGTGGDGGTAGAAIILDGGGNTLELHKGSTITGVVEATGDNNTLRLGGEEDSTTDFDVSKIENGYNGFAAFEKTGTKTWSLTGQDSSNTSWNIKAGTLKGKAESFGADQTVAAGAKIEFTEGSYDYVVSGEGSLIKSGSGTLTLTKDNTYTGGTTINDNSGTLQIGGGSTSGSIAAAGGVAVGDGSTLSFKRSDDITYGGNITGKGSLKHEGDGILTLTGVNSYKGTTTIAKSGATLAFDQSANQTLEGVISGDGKLEKSGSGTLTLEKTNTYAGGTKIKAGVLSIKNAKGVSGGEVDIDAGGALKLEYKGDFDNLIKGDGTLLVKTDDQTIVLKSNTTDFRGLTVIEEGTLQLDTNLENSSGLVMNYGTTFDTNSKTHKINSSGLTVYGGNANYTGDLTMDGAPLNFIATDDTTDTTTMLKVSGDANIGGSQFNVDMSGGTKLSPGTALNMLETTGGEIKGAAASGGMVRIGSTVAHDISLSADGTNKKLSGAVGAGRATEQAKALSEGFLGGMALATQGADLAAGKGMDAAVLAAAGPGGAYGMAGFGSLTGGSVRYDTGSYVDMNSISLMTGLSLGKELPAGRLTAGTFFEYGNGSYDTHNSFSSAASVDGDGDTYYLGGGVLGRMLFNNTGPGNVYVEGSARAGKLHNEYDSDDLRDATGRKAEYDSSSAYFGLHFGVGYNWNIDAASTLDLHGKYFWTRQESDRLELSTGENIHFNKADSHRLRIGSRFSHVLNAYVSPYGGLAWEHEFDGEAKASTNGYSIDAPDLQGSTGIAEVGLSVRPAETLPLTVDLGVQGYVGKREGVTGSLQFKLEF